MFDTRLQFAALLILPLLAGCTSVGLGGGDEPTPQVAKGQDLTMPPDLQLAEPGSGRRATAAPANEYDEPLPDTGGDLSAEPVEPAPRTQVATTAGQRDVYAKYNISKTRPDGTPKTEGELIDELRKAQLAEKRRKNPGYGTVFNAGGLFDDD